MTIRRWTVEEKGKYFVTERDHGSGIVELDCEHENGNPCRFFQNSGASLCCKHIWYIQSEELDGESKFEPYRYRVHLDPFDPDIPHCIVTITHDRVPRVNYRPLTRHLPAVGINYSTRRKPEHLRSDVTIGLLVSGAGRRTIANMMWDFLAYMYLNARCGAGKGKDIQHADDFRLHEVDVHARYSKQPSRRQIASTFSILERGLCLSCFKNENDMGVLLYPDESDLVPEV